MVGFNRRFSPLTKTMKKLLAEASGPKTFVATVNAGAIPGDHWTQDPNIGGGRIIGEACHFIDLIQFLCGSPIESVRTNFMESPCGDTASIELAFRDGSIGTVHYLANGSKSFPKERIEAFAGGRVLQLDNFRRLHGFGWPKFRHMRLWRQDKGQRACCSAFVNAVHNCLQSPIDFDEIINVSLHTIRAATQTTSEAS
jgi:predicted dehydrogenase